MLETVLKVLLMLRGGELQLSERQLHKTFQLSKIVGKENVNVLLQAVFLYPVKAYTHLREQRGSL